MSLYRTLVFTVVALCVLIANTGRSEDIANAQDASDELIKKYLAALDRFDIPEARRTLERAIQKAPCEPATELMQRHLRLLTKVKVGQTKAMNDRVYTLTYNVGDLVVPVPDEIQATGNHVEVDKNKPAPKPDFESLINLITSTIAVKTWQQNGGPGNISPFESNLSIVVCQTQAVHEEIADFLEQMRRTHDIQVVLETRVIELDPAAQAKIHVDLRSNILDRRKTSKLIKFAEKRREAKVLKSPNIALFPGQTAAVSRPADWQFAKSYSIQTIVSTDRRHIMLSLKAIVEKENPSTGHSVSEMEDFTEKVEEGGSLLADMSGGWGDFSEPLKASIARGGKLLLLITPRIVLQEEQEDKLGVRTSQ